MKLFQIACKTKVHYLIWSLSETQPNFPFHFEYDEYKFNDS